MKQQTCLVTGGAGFIGSHLVDFLLDKNFHVIAVDNLLTGSEQNLSQARDNARFSFIEDDVSKGIGKRLCKIFFYRG